MLRTLWLRLRLATLSLRCLACPAVRLGIEMVRVSARLRRKSRCRAELFLLSITVLLGCYAENNISLLVDEVQLQPIIV